MKKVLFVAYAFPPQGGPGVIRISKFCKYLPQFGWQPIVITSGNKVDNIFDQTLLDELPKDVQIHHISYIDPVNWFKFRYWKSIWLYFIYPVFVFPDRQKLWQKAAIKKGIELVRKEEIEVIFSSSGPISNHFVAQEIKKATGIKWVADFRDEWAENPYLFIKRPWQKNIARRLEKTLIQDADCVVAISDPLTAQLAINLNIKDKVKTIFNGFDSEDFKNLKKIEKKEKFCEILYAGSFYGGRQSNNFLTAVKELDLPDLQITLIGKEKHLTHQEAVSKMLGADILLLVLSRQDGPATFTSKIFEYLAAKKPILALSKPDTGAAKLINELKVGTVVDLDDLDAIKKAILNYYQAWKNNNILVPEVNLDQFDRRNLTEELAGIFSSFKDDKKKMRIMLVLNSQSPQGNNLVYYLSAQGYEIHLVSLSDTKIKGVKNYYINQRKIKKSFYPFYLLFGFLNKFRALYELKKLIVKIKPDIVHGHGVNFAGILSVYSGFHPVVVTTRGSDLMQIEKQPGFEQYLIRKSIQNAEIVTGNSVALQKKAIKLGLNPKKWREVYFGINTEIFRKKDTSGLRRELNLKDEKIIFSARSLKQIYNIDVLVRAVASLEEKNWKLIILVHNQDETYFKAVKEIINELKIEDKIIFLPSANTDKMVELYNLADVVVSIAQSDGAAATFLEAMACEAKVVISEVDFVSEWQEGKFWKVPIGNINKTAQAIQDALNTPKDRFLADGKGNREIIIARAELEPNFKKFEVIYKELMDRFE